jgi:hypothetical protein
MKKTSIAEVILILFGIFLIVDSLFLHLLFMVYPAPIGPLDNVIDHWMIGVVFIAIGVAGAWWEKFCS